MSKNQRFSEQIFRHKDNSFDCTSVIREGITTGKAKQFGSIMGLTERQTSGPASSYGREYLGDIQGEGEPSFGVQEHAWENFGTNPFELQKHGGADFLDRVAAVSYILDHLVSNNEIDSEEKHKFWADKLMYETEINELIKKAKSIAKESGDKFQKPHSS